jgi:hypothetical protein
LYGTRKPTGDPTFPPRVLSAKELKLAIDMKAGVIDLFNAAVDDDGVGVNVPLAQEDEEDALVSATTSESFESEGVTFLTASALVSTKN